MIARISVLVALLWAQSTFAQPVFDNNNSSPLGPSAVNPAAQQAPPSATPFPAIQQQPQTMVGTPPAAPPAAGFGAAALPQLPRQANQEWQEYNIADYTSRVTNVEKPQQAMIDWILRETGTDVWFSGQVALLNADRSTLRVYHTPQVQSVVREVYDRFVQSRAEAYTISMRLATVGNPNWRSKAHPMLVPVPVQTPGIEAWLLSKEHAAVLVGNLKKRVDYQEHNSPNVSIHNGQSHTVSRRRPRSFVRNVIVRPDQRGYDLDMGQFNEGYTLQISPLFSLDGNTIDAVLKCQVDQVERFLQIPIETPTQTGQRQRVQIQIPQVVSWRLHERFRWPADQVLLLSCGVTATPAPERPSPLGIKLPSRNSETGRADALLFIENKGKSSEVLINAQTANSDTIIYPRR